MMNTNATASVFESVGEVLTFEDRAKTVDLILSAALRGHKEYI